MTITLNHTALGTLTENVALIPVALGASGGTGPYVYALAAAPIAAPVGNESALNSGNAGALPFGLSLDGATGNISGTPQAVGDYRFVVTVTDALSASASFEFIGSVVRNASILGNGIDVVNNNSSDTFVSYGATPVRSKGIGVCLGGMTLELQSGDGVQLPAFELRRLREAGLID